MAGQEAAPVADEAVRTLRYWLDVEGLTAPGVEEIDDKGRYHRVLYLRDGDAMPWSAHDPKAPKAYFVRFGLFPRAGFEDELLRWLSAEATPDYGGRRREARDNVFLGVFMVDSEGRPLPETMQTAAFAPIFARMRGRGTGHAAFQNAMADRHDAACVDLSVKDGRVDAAFVKARVRDAVSLLGWDPTEGAEAPLAVIRVEDAIDERKRPREPQIPPLNGFYYDDIAAALEAAEA